MYSIRNNQFGKNHAKHKMTTDKQYNLLKISMASFIHNKKDCYNDNDSNGTLRYKQDLLHWKELTEKLNKFGPPYRTMQQWKKVWCDFKRSERKRKAKLKAQNIKSKPTCNNETSEREIDESDLETSTLGAQIKSETIDEQNSQSMYSTYSNDYDNDYSYPDEDSMQESFEDQRIFIPDESSCGSCTYPQYPTQSTTRRTAEYPTLKKHFPSPPPLQPANSPMYTQTLYTLQNQMNHQTKLLEYVSQMSSTMSSLMERQVNAAEMQTEAMHRQALATERHTAVMNKFLHMIREKMFKDNSQKTAASTDNSSNDTL